MKIYRWLSAALLLVSMAAFGASESLESSPWVGWRKGFDCFDRAGAFRDNAEFDRAMELYTESKEYFSAIARNFPDWNKAVVEGRIRLCDQEIAKLRKKGARKTAPAPAPARAPAPAALPADDFSAEIEEVSAPPPARTSRRRPARQTVNDYGEDWDAGAGGNRLTIELETELTQYRQRLRRALQEIDALQLKLQQAELRSRDVSSMMRDYRQLQEKYNLLDAQYRELKERAAVPDANLETLEAQTMELKMANDEAQRTIRRLKADASAHDEEYAASRREVLALKEKAQQAQNEIKRLEREVERAKRTGASAQEVGKLQAKIAEQDLALAAKEKEITALLNRLAAPGGKGSAEDMKEIVRLRGEVAALKASASQEKELRDKVSLLTAETERLAKQLQESEARLAQSAKEQAALLESTAQQGSARSVQSAELKSLRQHTAELEAELKAWGQRYADLEKRYRTSRDNAALALPDPEKEKAAAKRLSDAEAARRAAEDSLAQCRKELEAAQNLVKESREAVIESKAKLLEKDVEVQKLAALQKAYDELKAKWELVQKASDSDVLEALKRIPGLEESLRRYDAENKSLLKEIAALKQAVQKGRNQSASVLPKQSAADLEKIETLLADARSAEARSNFEVAIWGYRQVLGRDPENVQANSSLGMILLSRGNFDEAAQVLESAWRNRPAELRIANALARARIGKHDYAGALAVIDACKKECGKTDRDLQITEALAYSRSGKNLEAEKAFKEVLKLDPKNVEAAHELALLLSADEARRKEAGEFYLLAKDLGGEVDSYLEEVLKSVTGTDRATLDFLRKSAMDALRNGDWDSADWYIAEMKKMAPDQPTANRLEIIRLLLSGKNAEALAKLPKQDADCNDTAVRAKVLAANQKKAEAEALEKTVSGAKFAPEVLLLREWQPKGTAGK